MVYFIEKCWWCVAPAFGAGLLLWCLWLPGCAFDKSGLPPVNSWYECKADLWHCKRLPDEKPDIGLLPILGSSADIEQSEGAIRYPVMAEKDKTYPLYHDKDVVIYSISDDELKGSLLIPTGFRDWLYDGQKYLGIQFNNPIAGLYVAYDARDNIPGWLEQDYVLHYDENSRIGQIRTSLLNPLYGTGKLRVPRFLMLDLYRFKHPVAIGERILLPGNSFDKMGEKDSKQIKDWSEIKGGQPLMYTIFVKPKVEWDCSSGKKVDTVGFTDCFPVYTTQQTVESTALQEWDRKYPFLAKRNIQCKTDSNCADAKTLLGGALTVKPRTYIYSSEIEFGAPSSTAITIDDKGQTVSVKGRMHFEYLLKTQDLRLNSMELAVDQFSTDHGDFTDIAIYLLETAMAHCKGAAQPNLPCDEYELKPTTFFCAENFKRNGKPHLFISANSTSMTIAIDHPSRSFTMAGTLASSVQVNGDTLPINVNLHLTGKFVNFAPVPLGEESDTFSQCEEDVNMNPIQLYAGESYDVYEPLPAYQAAYQWIEDYGMLTEKVWGQGKAVTIGKGELAFGVHDITLVVEDTHGVAAATTLQVEVADTLPPQLQIPADVHMYFLEDPGPVKVLIGAAHATDMCSQEVMVTHNAPENRTFPSNQISEVTWRAEDLRGNVATGVQRVYVWILKPFRPQFERAVFFLREVIRQCGFELAACGDNQQQCFTDVTPLILSLDQLIAVSEAVQLPRRQKTELKQMTSLLKSASTSLSKAQQNVERSNVSRADRSSLRESARSDVRRALQQLSKGMK